jgi:mannose-6-phosphate isomerase-like protein (cupin superfamily)
MWRGPSDLRKELFGGTGEVSVTNLVAQPPAPFDCALGCVLSPGGSVGTHVQSECAELVVVISGTGVATVAGARLPLRAGATVAVPLGATLAFEADDAEPLYYVIVKAKQG